MDPSDLRVEHARPHLQFQPIAEQHHVLLSRVQHPERAILKHARECCQVA